MPKNPDFPTFPDNVQLSPELLFLIACCQEEITDKEIEFIHSFTQNSTLEAQNLITLANAHGVSPLVYKTIKNLSENNTRLIQHSTFNIQHFLSELKVNYTTIVQSNMFMSAELIRIIKLFREKNIEALPFKGPTLAQMAYKDITMRQFGDLDILIKKEELDQVEKLCLSMGYELHYDLSEVQKKSWYTYAKDMVFYHPQKKHLLEIHWLLLDADFPLQLELDAIWENPYTLTLNNTPLNTFPLESLLLYLCIHGSKHLWERIVWLKDIDLMLRTQNIDLEKVLADAKEQHSERMLLLGLYLSKMLFRTPLPKKVEILIQNEPVLPELFNDVSMHWKTPASIPQYTKVMLKFFPTFKMKARYLHKVILKPSHNEYRYIDLPKGFHWAYYLIRPFLLLKKYLTKNQ